MILHLGCGRKQEAFKERGDEVVTLDCDPFLNPDILCRLGTRSIPLPDNSVDTAIAIHVLEHIGKQGETKEWFFFWEDLYRVLKPGGRLEFESPLYSSVWAWGDPTHSRALSPQSFIFFCQDNYRIPHSAISPYRIKCDFAPISPFEGLPDTDPILRQSEQISHFKGCLEAKKPLNPWWDMR